MAVARWTSRRDRLGASMFVVGSACAVLAGVLSPAPAAAGTPQAGSRAVSWASCHAAFFCARLAVPLDYDEPGRSRISVALIKLPATDPAHRIGSLLVNPGGPGGSGVDFVRLAGTHLFTPAVRARFDIVGFDPRGINRSTPIRCFGSQDAESSLYPAIPYPTTPREEQQWAAGDRKLAAACVRRAGAVIDHMATADAARDLDRIRQAVGDRRLTYYGVSYGSMLGNTYANLFPARVRALVIDGVLDPVAWTTGRGGQGRTVPFTTRLHSAQGAMKTLSEFLRLCDAGGPRCAFAPHAASRYASLLRRLARHPLVIRLPDGRTLHYDETFLITDTLGAMYSSASWPDFAQFLVAVEQRLSATLLGQRRAALHLAGSRYLNFVEGFPGVACSDSVNPSTVVAWHRAAQKDGLFGPRWTWASSACASWPGQDADRFVGPFTARTARPVLVVGNLADPATPYPGAVTAARLLPRSSLLTVHGWGHTSLFLSACADRNIARYLLTSQPPPVGTVCQQDVVPFSAAATAAPGLRLPVPSAPHWLSP